MGQEIQQTLYQIFNSNDIGKIFDRKKLPLDLKGKKERIEHLIKNEPEIVGELIRIIEEFKGCNLDAIKNETYAVLGKLDSEIEKASSVGNIISRLIELDQSDRVKIISGLSRFSARRTIKGLKIKGRLKYENLTESRDEILRSLEERVKSKNTMRYRKMKIKSLNVLENQHKVTVSLYVERGSRTFFQFKFRQFGNPKPGNPESPDAFDLVKSVIYPLDTKLISIDYRYHEYTTNWDETETVMAILESFYELSKEKTEDIPNLTVTEGEGEIREKIDIEEVIKERIKDELEYLNRDPQGNKKKIEIVEKIHLKKVGVNLKNIKYAGNPRLFIIRAGDFEEFVDKAGISDILDELADRSKDYEYVLEYRNIPIVVTRTRIEFQGTVSEYEKEIISKLVRRDFNVKDI